MKARPPPSAPPPISGQDMAVIKKKIAPPIGPPPPGMLANFKAPKKYDEDKRQDKRGSNKHDDNFSDEENYEDDNHNDSSRQERWMVDEMSDINDELHDSQPKHSHHIDSGNNRFDADMKNIARNEASSDSNPYAGIMRNSPMESLAIGSNEGLKIYNFRKILRATFKELRQFILSGCEKNMVVRCYIERNRSGINAMAPVYSLCADLEDGTGRELITCRKIIKSRTSHYVFSLKEDDLYRKREQRSRLYLGKLRAVTADDYIMYDNGVCEVASRPYDSKSSENEKEDFDDDNDEVEESRQGATSKGNDEDSLYRTEVCVVHFNTKVRPCNQNQRGMEVAIPALSNMTHDMSSLNTVNSVGASLDSVSSNVAKKNPHLSRMMEKVMRAGRQNDLYANKVFVMHERQSK